MQPIKNQCGRSDNDVVSSTAKRYRWMHALTRWIGRSGADRDTFVASQYWESRHQAHAGSLRATGHVQLSDADNAADFEIRVARIADALVRFAPADGKRTLLDAGCGCGVMSERYVRQGFAVTGVDFSSSAIGQARMRSPDVDFHVSSLVSVELNRRFDAIVVSEVLLHVVDESDWRRTLETLDRHLSPSGVLIIVDSLIEPAADLAGHCRHRPVHAYRSAMRELGLVVAEHTQFDLPREGVTKDMLVVRRVR